MADLDQQQQWRFSIIMTALSVLIGCLQKLFLLHKVNHFLCWSSILLWINVRLTHLICSYLKNWDPIFFNFWQWAMQVRNLMQLYAIITPYLHKVKLLDRLLTVFYSHCWTLKHWRFFEWKSQLSFLIWTVHYWILPMMILFGIISFLSVMLNNTSAL